MRMTCRVNGEERVAEEVWPGESLLYVLRERLGLPGSKNACEQGECGSCTVYLDGVPVCSCLVAAGQAEPPAAATGVPAVDEVLASMADLADRPVAEHVAVFEQAHDRLRRALDARPDS